MSTRTEDLAREARELASEVRRLDIVTDSLRAEARDRAREVQRLEADLSHLNTRLSRHIDNGCIRFPTVSTSHVTDLQESSTRLTGRVDALDARLDRHLTGHEQSA